MLIFLIRLNYSRYSSNLLENTCCLHNKYLNPALHAAKNAWNERAWKVRLLEVANVCNKKNEARGGQSDDRLYLTWAHKVKDHCSRRCFRLSVNNCWICESDRPGPTTHLQCACRLLPCQSRTRRVTRPFTFFVEVRNGEVVFGRLVDLGTLVRRSPLADNDRVQSLAVGDERAPEHSRRSARKLVRSQKCPAVSVCCNGSSQRNVPRG